MDGAAPAPAEEAFVSLYRRFRPSRFAELRGQPHVVRALQGAVRDGHVAHAYLFSGPRGTGKTSTARILAKALNCAHPVDGEPCGVCASCVEIARGHSLDVHELDAASNNGVDAMRDLVAHAALGTPGRWKIYIVDEVHMLSNAAANALLKTLEEPPAHVVFVLATTDPQKVPATIRSRTQHLEFRLLGADTLESLLRDVRDRAGLDLSDDALSVAVRRGRGSARDALSALDQVVASGSADDARPELTEILDALTAEDGGRVLVAVAALVEGGWGAQQLATELVDELRQSFLAAMAPELAAATGDDLERLVGLADGLGLPRLVRAMEALGRALVDMRDAPDPRVVVEVTLVRVARPDLDDSTAALTDRVARLERLLAEGAGATPPPAAGRSPLPASPSTHAPTGERPALGAVRRRSSTPEPPTPEPPTQEAPTLEPSIPEPPTPEASTPEASNPEATPQPSPTGSPDAGGPPKSSPALAGDPEGLEPTASPVPTIGPTPVEPDSGPTADRTPLGGPPADPPPSAGALPDRDSLQLAWGDHVLRRLPARAKARYSAGRFVGVEDGVALFALPNAAHRDFCAEVQAEVEAALGAHFGSPVPLRLVVDDGVTGAGVRAAGARTAPEPPGASGDLDDDDDFDPDDAREALPVESVAEARLLEAFPGATEVTD